jgi:membrane protein DedA with SNARE-associated domain
MHRKFPALGDEKNEVRIRDMHRKYGALALMLSRFIPGVRAVVPPFAGALRLSPISTMLSISVASAIWYGTVSYLAFKAGADWEALTRMVTRSGRIAAIVAVAMVATGALVWWLRQRSQRAPQ